MKAGFVMTNSTVTRVDWSFMSEVFRETVVKEEGVCIAEKGEVTSVVHASKDVVVIDELEEPEASEQPTNTVPDVSTSHYTILGQLD